jgi:ubiquinone/menaquinone biosynthesis C-methylase UbiE
MAPAHDDEPREHHLCPWWVGFLLACPLRRFRENPERMLGPYTGPGMTVVDVGSAMGFFSLPAARLVGEGGRVICVDVQERMLKTLRGRARRRKLDHIIETRVATQESLGLEDLDGRVDLVLAAHVVHESTAPRAFLDQCRRCLHAGGRLLVVEPKGHVSDEEFETTRALAREVGLAEESGDELRSSRVVVLRVP